MVSMLVTKILHRFGRISRKLHTNIISQETIKPSSPTPSHLKTHNLSIIDFLSPNIHLPWLFFYKNYNINGTVNINILKKSLSQCLTHYCPFAGRIVTPHAPHIDCNDQGVEFLESSIPGRLDDFILKKHQDETLDQLIPNALGCAANKTAPDMVAVQLSHFTCGGAAVAVSISHKIADGFTMAHFVNHWSILARGGSPISPTNFFSSSISNIKIPDFPVMRNIPKAKVKYATRRFVFPDSKLKELKNKIRVNPTRVESLTSLLFKRAACAATTKSGSLKPSILNQPVNLRGKTHANFPELAYPGNLFSLAIVERANSEQIELDEVITGMRKEVMEIYGARGMEEIGERMVNAGKRLRDDGIRSYTISSVCRLPYYEVDFGWGKPVRVMLRSGGVEANYMVLMDSPTGDGIEATVQLEEEEMMIFQEDEELNAFAEEM